ncbi:hypothetical protein EUTSA_v10002911mg [Eutrema salsugineum]|uniref:F-box domain-containing protein n=1 Tax=Eutrema salsugineum TaxID=72664 RepID=V4L0S3_EUTSA|nr:F-box protein At3g22350 [Eutrema salsugineum]ESQ37224.1 hypothetical protein EUTSA_v10002911mg [Eutrema salsugineum]
MSYLPSELVEEILSRVPAISLIRLRSTCKQWKALFNDRGFTEKHFSKAPKQSLGLLVMLKESRIFSMNVMTLSFADPSSNETKVPLVPNYYFEQVNIFQVFHCSGLLLCTTKDNGLVVWNPCLEETRWIQPKTDNERYLWSSFFLGYENNKFCHTYKILRCDLLSVE